MQDRVKYVRLVNLLIPLYRTYRNIIVVLANDKFQLADQYRSQGELYIISQELSG